MNWLGQRKNSKSYKRWIRKYDKGQVYKMSRRRKFKARSSTKRRKSSAINDLRKKVARLEKGQTGKEFKYHDVTHTDASSTATTIECLNMIAEGTTSITRNALMCNLQSIYMKTMYNSNDATDVAVTIRVILLIDRENNGAAPTVLNVLESAGLTTFREKHANRSRFKILYDKNIILTPKITGSEVSVFKEYYKKFKKPIKLNYLGANASVAHTGKNALYWMHFSNLGANLPTMTMNCRLRFTD